MDAVSRRPTCRGEETDAPRSAKAPERSVGEASEALVPHTSARQNTSVPRCVLNPSSRVRGPPISPRWALVGGQGRFPSERPHVLELSNYVDRGTLTRKIGQCPCPPSGMARSPAAGDNGAVRTRSGVSCV